MRRVSAGAGSDMVRGERARALPRLVTTVIVLVALAFIATACGREATGGDIPDPAELPGETVEVSVFFSSGRSLVQESRVIDANDIYRGTFDELLAAQPAENPDIAVVQPEATINDITVKDGVMSIDWSPEVLDFEATDKEKTLALASILMTAGQFPEVNTVQFTVQGKTEGTLNGKDIRDFWVRVGLAGQPWDVLRPPVKAEEGTETTSTAGSSETTTSAGSTDTSGGD